MARVVGYRAGGIHRLLELYDEHSEALEYDLIALGLRWRDVPSRDLDWGDVRAIVLSSPRTSALRRARDPERSAWDANTYVLANVVEELSVVAYLLSRIRGAHPKRPKPYPRPGETPDGVQRFTSKPVPLAELRKRLGRDKST